MNSEKPQSVDQRLEAVLALLSAQRATFARQGAVVTTWRQHSGRRVGPYFRLAYRSGKRQRSVYLGTCPVRAARVRTVLDELQAPLQHTRTWERWLRCGRQALRMHKRSWDEELRCQGLYLKGFEVRSVERRPTP